LHESRTGKIAHRCRSSAESAYCASIVGAEKATALFEAAYDEHAHRMANLYAKVGYPSYVSENK
jgi:hypothetical protein